MKFNKVIYSNVLISLAAALRWVLLAFEIPEVVVIRLVSMKLTARPRRPPVIILRKYALYFYAPLNVQQRRLEELDFSNIENLSEREAFLCGPDNLMKLAQEWLQSYSGGTLKIHQESYSF